MLTVLVFSGVELLTAVSRVSFIVWLSVYYAAGSMVFTVLAYGVRNWRSLAIYGTAPFSFVFFYWFFLPESPRWLMVTEQFKKLEAYLRNVAKINKRPYDEKCHKKFLQLIDQCEREVNLEYGSVRITELLFNQATLQVFAVVQIARHG